ncbi:GatB/YqeY domain-containing protein [Rhodohalobacter sp. SW132]|uniref:GatB/YqeY domain-containing protein n=1 Tax=Rhodohalobacter sp. SW132 TaxID=2293433 RepID=UPI000E281A58|nr:GatB/YqeY domain-containing protein [Rhodohalobacter sp. SW132]REL39109.1 GatB/YqeY domain-containing protein [Rhodohalobacter sp. SW132]
MSIKQSILDDLKTAMKQKEADRLRVLRSLKAKILEKEISERKDGEAELSDEQVIEVLMKAAKQRKESIEQFEDGGRGDLAEKEKAELEIIEEFLPKMMSEEEVRAEVKDQIESMGASSMADMGKVMGVMMGKLKGKAEGSVVSKVVKEELS